MQTSDTFLYKKKCINYVKNLQWDEIYTETRTNTALQMLLKMQHPIADNHAQKNKINKSHLQKVHRAFGSMAQP